MTGASTGSSTSTPAAPRAALPHTVTAVTWPLRLTCVEPAGVVRRQEPVTSGVPFPSGLVRDAGSLALRDSGGRAVPLAVEVTARWPDGSVKWALLRFAADVPANGVATLLLAPEDDPAGRAKSPQPELAVRPAGRTEWTVERSGSGGAVARLALFVRAAHEDGTQILPEAALLARPRSGQPEVQLDLTLTNRTAAPVQVEMAELLCAADGKPRQIAYPGLDGASVVRDVSDRAAFQLVQRGPTAWGEAVPFTLHDGAGNTCEGRLDAGWCAVQTDEARASLAVRRFAALHPKGLAASAAGEESHLAVQLVPAGTSVGVTLLPGMSMTTEMLLRLEPVGDAEAAPLAETAAALARAFDAPLQATADPAWVCATGALGDLVPADAARFPRYEWLTRSGLDALATVREARREYGQIDYGDWAYDRYPRGWGNGEYDLSHALFLLYARSGERRFFDWAVDAARHFRDVDVNHGGHPGLPAGAPHVHVTDHAARGNDLGHTWLEGLLNWHCFTGDARALETARGIADFCIAAAARTEFARRSERGMGWLLICLTEMHRFTGEATYLDGCAPIVEQALAWQDPAEGNWPNPIGECRNSPKCVGGKPFMVGMVLEGLRRYHRLTGDAHVGDAIVRASRWLVRDGVWVARDHGFVYATCHQYLDAGRTGEIRELDGLLYAYELAGERRFLDVALDAWEAAFHPVGAPYRFDGKGYATMTRSTPHVLAALARLAPDRVW